MHIAVKRFLRAKLCSLKQKWNLSLCRILHFYDPPKKPHIYVMTMQKSNSILVVKSLKHYCAWFKGILIDKKFLYEGEIWISIWSKKCTGAFVLVQMWLCRVQSRKFCFSKNMALFFYVFKKRPCFWKCKFFYFYAVI